MLTQAQITNKIWNLSLGVSTKQQVTAIINSRHLKVRERGLDYITCSPNIFEFGGESWNYAKFRFFNGKLYLISFRYTSTLSVRENFDRLKNSLDNKYSQFLRDKNLTTYGDWYVTYDDGKTTVDITYNIVQGSDYVGIMYYDDALMRRLSNQSQSEL